MKKTYLIKILATFMAIFIIADFAFNKFIIHGLKKYYGLTDTTNLALIGHSQLMLGLDKRKIEENLKIQISKYTRAGVNVTDRYYMIKQLLESNSNIDTIIYGVDPWSFTERGLSKNSFKLFYPFIDDDNIQPFLKKSTTTFDYYLKKFIRSTRLNEQIISSSMRGYFENWNNLKFGLVDLSRFEKEVYQGEFRRIENSDLLINDLKKTLLFLAKREITVILVNMPVIDLLLNPQQAEYDETVYLFKEIAEKSEYVEYLFFNKSLYSDYDLFFDSIHLNPKGQKVITNEFLKYINNIKK